MQDEDIKAFGESLLVDATKPSTHSDCECKACELQFANETCDVVFVGGLIRMLGYCFDSATWHDRSSIFYNFALEQGLADMYVFHLSIGSHSYAHKQLHPIG